MDPLAHTFVGGAIAASGLRRLTPLGAATLMIGANLPDVDAITYAMGDDLSLAVRRGWTHGALAIALWPLALTGAMLLVDRFRSRRRLDAPRARAGRLLLLSVIAVASHPALDWLNTYGIRLLMPFDGHWFYGDTLFIADPWIWVIVGTAAALLASRHRLGAFIVLGAAAATSLIMLLTPLAPPAARVAWCVLVALGAALVLARPEESRARRLAMASLAIAALYIATMRLGAERARTLAAGWLEARHVSARLTAALPVPADPFTRDVVALAGDRYHFVAVNWLTGSAASSGPTAPVGGPNPITDAAMRAPWVRGLAIWLRFPSFDVQQRGDGYRVYVRDVRFWRPDRDWGVVGFGRSVVDLDHALRPLQPPEVTNGYAASGSRSTPDHPCVDLSVRQSFGLSVPRSLSWSVSRPF